MMADMTLREALDHVRAYQTKIVKPFEKLGEALEAAFQTIEHDLPAAKREVEQVGANLRALKEETPNVEAAAVAAKASVADIQRQAQEADTHARAQIAASETRARDREAALLRAHKDRMGTLEQEYEARKTVLTGDVTALEAKKAALDQAIAAVRAKF